MSGKTKINRDDPFFVTAAIPNFRQLGIRRAAYLKYGDVALEYEQLQKKICLDGDLGYLGRFYALSKGINLLVLSFGTRRCVKKDKTARICVFNLKKSANRFAKYSDNVLKLAITAWLIIRQKPDFILCGTLDMSLWGAFIAAKLIRRPIIYSAHNTLLLSDTPMNNIRKKIVTLCIKHCGAVMCNGPYLKDEMLRKGVSPVKLVEFLPTLGQLTQKTGQARSLPHDYMLFFGRLETQKGVHDLLTAYEKLPRELKTTHLVYAGNGSCLESLKIRTAQRGLAGTVHFLGKIPYARLGDIIRKSRFVIIPSKKDMGEGICKAALESLFLKRPVIAPDYGVFPYLLHHGKNALLYKTDAIDDLCQKLRLLLTDKVLHSTLEAGAAQAGQAFGRPDKTFSHAIVTCLNHLGFNAPSPTAEHRDPASA